MTGGGHLPQRSQPANLGPTVFQPPVSQLVCDGCIQPGVECGSIVIAPVWLLATLQPLRSLLFDAFGDVHPSASSSAASCVRSEEHTSELQSLMRISYAVFCLKKKIHTTDYQQTP